MSSGPTPASPWRDTAPTPTPAGHAWRATPPRPPRRTRWRWLTLVAVTGLGVLAAVTWAVFWLRPPQPAHLVVLVAGYDNTLAVPPNPYGKAAARDLSALARPGSWFGTRSHLNGQSTPTRLTRLGLPDLSRVRGRCVVAVLAAHGGRDRDGAFLFPEDAGADPSARLRIKAVIDQLAKQPVRQNKLLILDATDPPAYPDLGLVHNDFATAVEELNDAIAAVPNLAVFMSTGPDQRSWTSPEWGHSSFVHHVYLALRGGADANRDRRITGAELVNFVRPRVREWARDNRAAYQTPVLLPRGEEGESRVAAMHLSMTDWPQPDEPAPTPFDPPPELEQQWAEYRTLANAYVPPTAYTPHLWRQYEAWTLRHEQHVVAGDGEGARNARDKAAEVRRQIEAARKLPVSPQTLALPSAVGGVPWVADVPTPFRIGIEQLAAAVPAERAAVWGKVRAVAGVDPDAARGLWCRALVTWAAVDPVPRLPLVPGLVPLVTEGMPVVPAEVNFLRMVARHVPPAVRKEDAGAALEDVLRLRLNAEQSLAGLVGPATGPAAYPFAEYTRYQRPPESTEADVRRRFAEDRSFSDSEAAWQQVRTEAAQASSAYARVEKASAETARHLREWHRGTTRLHGTAEWVARSPVVGRDPVAEEDLFRNRLLWGAAHEAAHLARPGAPSDAPPGVRGAVDSLFRGTSEIDAELSTQAAELLTRRSETDSRTVPRADSVRWWHTADRVLTAPPADSVPPAARRDLVREFRRASRQLLVTDRTRAETLPELAPEKEAERAREIALEAANRRGQILLGRLGGPVGIPLVAAVKPGEGYDPLKLRLEQFAYQAEGRASLAAAGSRMGELLAAVATLGGKPGDVGGAERWLRASPAHAAVTDAPLNQARRERVRDYLVAQARRTYLDHWYGEGGTRYYQTAIEQLVADSRGVIANPPTAPNPFQEYLSQESPFPVLPTAPRRFAVTDEPDPELRVAFTRTPPPGIDGLPVFWSTPPFEPKGAKPAREARVLVPTNPELPAPEFVRKIPRPDGVAPVYPVTQTGAVQITGFFRGRRTPLNVPVDIYRTPDRTAVKVPGLASTAIAVRADPRVRARFGLGVGAVAIVLDCSGSLGPADRKDPMDRGLYPQAVKALGELLRELPPGTTVAVSVFGARTPGAKAAEETIKEVLPPTPLPFDTAPIVEQVDRAVAGLDPWDLSPATRAVLAAKDRIKNDPVPFKAVVLISDCIDTRFADDPANVEPKRTIADALRGEFPPDGVALSVVALPVPKTEAAAQGVFREVEKLKPAGLFVPPEDIKKLAAWLRTGLNARVRFTLSPVGGAASEMDFNAGTDSADNWYVARVDPGTYSLRVSGARDFAQRLNLDPGDRLLIDLTEDRGALSAARHWFADTAAGFKSGKPADAWRVSLLQNRSEAGGLRLFAAVEEHPPTGTALAALATSHVGDVWFEVRAVVPTPPAVAARWRTAPGFPAPAWSLDVPGWPAFPGGKGPASPTVSAWWNPDGPFPAGGSWVPANSVPLLQTRQAPAQAGGAAVTLESVTVEEHVVDVNHEGKRESRKCLVVRLSSPPGNPAWVRPLGTTAAGSEVRVYRAANRVTCLFWGIDPSAVTGFDVSLLSQTLADAVKRGHHATIDGVPAPSPVSPVPERPTEPR